MGLGALEIVLDTGQEHDWFARALEHAGSTSADATRQAYGAVYRTLVQQAQTLAYLDAFYLLAWFAAAMVPLVFLTRAVKGGTMGH